MTQPPAAERDLTMLRRCIELSRSAIDAGEDPFACIICVGDRVIAETTTRSARDGDITRHAEMLALAEAQKALGGRDLGRCSIYCNVEPCAMCAFGIRETRIARVIYAIPSPLMGGRSKWDILGDADISDALPEVFGRPPEVVGGLLENEAAEVWRAWHPIDWAVLRHRHAFGKLAAEPAAGAIALSPPQSVWQRLRSWFGARAGR